MLTFNSGLGLADPYYCRERPLAMASRYAPKEKEDLYEEVCRVITGEQGTGEDAWRKAMHTRFPDSLPQFP